jgi:CHASE3 domain sensor protein
VRTAPRQPRQGPPRRARPVVAREPPPRRSRFGRLLALLVVIALFGGVAVGVVLSSDHTTTAVHLRTIATHDVPTIVHDLNDLVSQNTG